MVCYTGEADVSEDWVVVGINKTLQQPEIITTTGSYTMVLSLATEFNKIYTHDDDVLTLIRRCAPQM